MSDPTRLSRRYSTMVVATISLIVLTCVAYLIPVPYVTMRPGPAFDTLGKFDDQQMFTFGDGVKTYPTSGSLDFTTVSVTRADSKVSLVDAVTSWFDRDVAVVPKSLVYPDNQTAQQSTAASAAQLDGSKDASRVAALRAAGYTVTERPQVAGLTEGGAATDLLEVGDVITQVDGTDVTTSQQAVGIIAGKKPGAVVSITVERKGATKTVDVTTRPADDDPP